MFPPRLTAPEKVTKSFSIAPWLVLVTVMIWLPFDAAKVTAPADVVVRMGVMSL